MTTIDELGRRAAASLRADVGDLVDDDHLREGVARVGRQAAARTATGRRSAWSRGALAAAAALIVVIATVVVATDHPTRTIHDVPTAPADTSTVSVPESTASTALAPISTGDPSTTAATDVPAVEPPPRPLPPPTDVAAAIQTILVSYLDPPPMLDLQPFASLRLAPPSGPPDGPHLMSGEVAVGEAGVVVVDGVANTAVVVDWSGRIADTVPLTVSLSTPVAGPVNVLYGLTYTGPGNVDYSMVAIALAGPLRGKVVAREPVDVNLLVEAPEAMVGHGRNGVVLRQRQVDMQLIGYVDETGVPVTMDSAATATIDDSDLVSLHGGPSWRLAIDRDPSCCRRYGPNSPPAPSDDGRVVYWTEIGAPIDVTQDFSPSSIDVLADLRADGSGRWWTIPGGWSVVASDQWGTILGRSSPEAFDLARLPRPARTEVTFDPQHDLDRPLLDGPSCTSTWASDTTNVEFRPFARADAGRVPVQVFAGATGSIEDPFVVVTRYFGDDASGSVRHDAEVAGRPAQIDLARVGDAGSVRWQLPDGSEMHVHNRGFAQADLLEIAAALTPRAPATAIPGADLIGEPFGLSLLDETVTPLQIDRVAASGCVTSSGDDITVRTLLGRPAATFTAYVDQSTPYPPARMLSDGAGTIAVTDRASPTAAAAALAGVRPATDSEWQTLLDQPGPADTLPGRGVATTQP